MDRTLTSKEDSDMINYVNKTLNNIHSGFYYNLHTLYRATNIMIHNQILEEKLPLLFPKDIGCHMSTLAHLPSIGYSLSQSFVLGSGNENEGEEWKDEVRLATFDSVNRLIKEFGQIIIPDKNIEVIDARYGDTKVTPSIINFFDDRDEYSFTMLTLERVIEKELKDLPLELNLRIFYEFFEDLR